MGKSGELVCCSLAYDPWAGYSACVVSKATRCSSTGGGTCNQSGRSGEGGRRCKLMRDGWFAGRRLASSQGLIAVSKHYPVVDVKRTWTESYEWMGTKEKFWYLDSRSGERWLFKSPRSGTGEHWAEKISSELADLLGIDHARTELATFEGSRGSVSASFVSKQQQLTHGNELLARTVEGYDGKKKFKQTDHTLGNIWRVMENAFEGAERTRQAKVRIGENLVLDALVGNTDRHHENWGLLKTELNEHFEEFVAPSYDHASALGRELLDSRRASLLSSGGVGRYVEKGRGAIYWASDDSRALSPLELVRRTAVVCPEVLQPVLARVRSLHNATVADLVEGVPRDWMSRPARDFTLAMICYSMDELGRLS